MAHKKRAWNMSNPLYRYLHRSKKHTKKSRGGKMVRHRRGKSSGGGMLSRGIMPVGGLLGAAILGVGAAALAKRFIGAPLGGFTGAALGFTVGGVGGAAGGWLHDNIGNLGGGATGGPLFG